MWPAGPTGCESTRFSTAYWKRKGQPLALSTWRLKRQLQTSISAAGKKGFSEAPMQFDRLNAKCYRCTPQQSVQPVNDLPAQNGSYHAPRQLAAVKWAVARQGTRLAHVVGPARLGVEDGDVGMIAALETAARFQPDHAGGPAGEQLHDSA